MRPHLLLLSVVVACGGGGGDLDPETVTNLPPGDGAGTAATGTYDLETVTTGCAGDCTATTSAVWLAKTRKFG